MSTNIDAKEFQEEAILRLKSGATLTGKEGIYRSYMKMKMRNFQMYSERYILIE
jgi:hypothetical protein